MEIILNKIYLEQNKMRFGDMHNAITDYFDDNGVDYTKYLAPSETEGSETSMFILGIFALLRTYKNHPEQRKIVKLYIDELCTVIDTTNFLNDYLDLPSIDGIIDSIKAFFSSNEELYKKNDDLLDKNTVLKNRFNHMVNIMYKVLPKSYAADCVIQLTISVLVFENIMNVLKDYSNDNVFNQYIINLKEITSETDENGICGESNCRGYIEF
jgi:hypothetical protein